jgi:hypothetical protein
MSGAILVAALAFVCHACASPALAPPAVKTAEVASTRALPPTVEELKNATYAGLGERLGPVTLANGRWTGAPPALGAASRPSVELADDFRVVGDLDGDGLEEAVAVLTYSSGGTGILSFLAVVTREDGTLRNVATTTLGGKTPSPRHEFFYFNDDGSLVSLRHDNGKVVFAEQRAHGMDVWREPFVVLRMPKLFNLRADPFEQADNHTMGYDRWMAEHFFLRVPVQEYVGKFRATFKEFPPSQKVGSFGIDQALEKLTQGAGET